MPLSSTREPAARVIRPHAAPRLPRRPDAARPGIEAARALRDMGMSDERIVSSFVTAGMTPSTATAMLRALRHDDRRAAEAGVHWSQRCRLR